MSFFQTVLITKGNYFFARNQFSLQYVERAWLPFGTTAAKEEGEKALLLLSAFPLKGGGKDILFVQKGGGKEGAHNSLCNFSLPLFPSPYSNSFPQFSRLERKEKEKGKKRKQRELQQVLYPQQRKTSFFPSLTHYV